jgi:hypothetical protein
MAYSKKEELMAWEEHLCREEAVILSFGSSIFDS